MVADEQDGEFRLGQRPLDFGMEPVTDVDEFLVEPDVASATPCAGA